MIANLSFLQKRRDMSREAFSEHWISPHGPLAASLPHLRHYTQFHVLDTHLTSPDARKLDIDGVPCLWFSSEEELRASYRSDILDRCNEDSVAFIGAVTRVVASPERHAGKAVTADGSSPVHLMFVLSGMGPHSGWLQAMMRRLGSGDGITDYVGYDILSQSCAPNSRIGGLDFAVGGVCTASFRDGAVAERFAAIAGEETPAQSMLCTFEVNPIRFV